MTRPLAVLALAAACAAPLDAISQEACLFPPGPRIAVTGLLTRCCGETQIEVEVTDGSFVLEFWGNPRTGTWSVVRTSPRGISCLTASGRSWRPVPGIKT